MSRSGDDDRDERIRLLEYQVAFLHRELTFVTRRYEDIVYSAAWTLARPVKWIEDAAHRLVKSWRAQPRSIDSQDAAIASPPAAGSAEDRIAARIAAAMERPQAGG